MPSWNTLKTVMSSSSTRAPRLAPGQAYPPNCSAPPPNAKFDSFSAQLTRPHEHHQRSQPQPQLHHHQPAPTAPLGTAVARWLTRVAGFSLRRISYVQPRHSSLFFLCLLYYPRFVRSSLAQQDKCHNNSLLLHSIHAFISSSFISRHLHDHFASIHSPHLLWKAPSSKSLSTPRAPISLTPLHLVSLTILSLVLITSSTPTQKRLACPPSTVCTLFSFYPSSRSHIPISASPSGLPDFEPCRSHGQVHLQQFVHDQLSRLSLHSSPHCFPRCVDVLERRRDVLRQHLRPRASAKTLLASFLHRLSRVPGHLCLTHATASGMLCGRGRGRGCAGANSNHAGCASMMRGGTRDGGGRASMM
jgi:hypothetical protein